MFESAQQPSLEFPTGGPPPAPRKNRRKSQKEVILEFLKSGRSLTDLEAFRLFGVRRLAARIHELREDGHRIQAVDERSGVARFARYRLVKAV